MSDEKQPKDAPPAPPPQPPGEPRSVGVFAVQLTKKGEQEFNTLQLGRRWSFSR